VSKLYQAKHPLKYILYPGADHGLNPFGKSNDAEICNLFDYYLRDKEPLPNMEKHGN